MAIQYRRDEISEFKRRALEMILLADPSWTDAKLGAALGVTASGAMRMRHQVGIAPARPQMSAKKCKGIRKPKATKGRDGRSPKPRR